jgi:chromosome partitioning protein
MLCQEICRVGWQSDYIIIDVAGHDSGIARRAIALADTLITPVNSSFVDLDLLGHFHPITLEVTSKGCFAATVEEIRQARIKQDLPDLDWIVVKNRMRHTNSKNQSRITQALKTLAPLDRFRLASGLSERVAYRELFLLGLTYMDIKHVPELARVKLRGPDEIGSLIRDLHLTTTGAVRRSKIKSEIETELELLNEWMETSDDGAGKGPQPDSPAVASRNLR